MTYQPHGGVISSVNSTTTPFTGRRIVQAFRQLATTTSREYRSLPEFPPKTDLWWEATNSGGTSGSVSVQFQLTLISDS